MRPAESAAARAPVAAEARDGGEYDLVLRCTEAAARIGHVAARRCAETRPQRGARARAAALRAAIARRGDRGRRARAAAAGRHRAAPARAHARGLVSIIIPTCAARGLSRPASRRCASAPRIAISRSSASTISATTDSPGRSGCKQQRRRVVEYPGPFNWSRFNNRGAAAALRRISAVPQRRHRGRSSHDWLDACWSMRSGPRSASSGRNCCIPTARCSTPACSWPRRHGAPRLPLRCRRTIRLFRPALTQRNVIAVTGACMLMRREVFERARRLRRGARRSSTTTWIAACAMWRGGPARRLHAACAADPPRDGEPRRPRRRIRRQPASTRAGAALSRRRSVLHPAAVARRDDIAPEPEPARSDLAGHPLFARGDIRRILVVKLDHIGDFITALPAIRRLKRHFPQAEIPARAPRPCALRVWSRRSTRSSSSTSSTPCRSRVGATIGEEDWSALAERLSPIASISRSICASTPRHARSSKQPARGCSPASICRAAFPGSTSRSNGTTDQPYLEKRARSRRIIVALVEAVSVAFESERRFVAAPPAERRSRLSALPAFAELRARPVRPARSSASIRRRQRAAAMAGGAFRLGDRSHRRRLRRNVALIGAPSEEAVAEAMLARCARRTGSGRCRAHQARRIADAAQRAQAVRRQQQRAEPHRGAPGRADGRRAFGGGVGARMGPAGADGGRGTARDELRASLTGQAQRMRAGRLPA